MCNSKWLIRLSAIILFVIGFYVPWWPLMFFAPFLAVYFGYWILALVLAVCTDLLFGVPVGMLHAFIFPCTIAILACIVVRSLLIRHLR
jgi:hypothetical protein